MTPKESAFFLHHFSATKLGRHNDSESSIECDCQQNGLMHSKLQAIGEATKWFHAF